MMYMFNNDDRDGIEVSQGVVGELAFAAASRVYNDDSFDIDVSMRCK